MPANFRSEEGQRRLLTALIAAHPELKLNYKEIHKYYGDSTPDGIQFQFRSIKQGAANMRQGKGAAVPSTPGGRAASSQKTPRTTGTGSIRKRAAPSSAKTPTSKKSKSSTAQALVIDDDSDTEDNVKVPAPVLSPPKINEQVYNAYTASQQTATAPAAAPSLASAQAASPTEDEAYVTTPSDGAATFFNSNGNGNGSQAYSTSYSFSQPAAVGGGGGGERYESTPFYNPNSSYGFPLKVEDDEYEV